MKSNIILVGLMGAGKSTLGRQLAKRFRMEFYDSDKVIEEKTGVSIPTIFAIEGESGFREREEQIIEELSRLQGVVIATGGGSILRQSNRERLKASGCVIYLKASPEQLYSRIRHDRNRPLMQTQNPLQTLRQLLHDRETYYLEVADIVMPTSKQKVSYLVNLISQQINQLPSSVQESTHANIAS